MTLTFALCERASVFGFGKRRRLEERIELMRLDLARIEGCASLTNLLLATLVQQGHRKMAQLDDIISALNANTNAVATRLDHLIAQLTTASQAPTAGQLADLQAVADHLRAMGADATDPLPASPVVPAPAPAAPAAPEPVPVVTPATDPAAPATPATTTDTAPVTPAPVDPTTAQ